jgi:hypothetical protein
MTARKILTPSELVELVLTGGHPAARRWLRDETGVVIGERSRWRWRTLRNSETGAIRHERGPLAVQYEWGATRLEVGRLWLVWCAPKHPHRWMIIWRAGDFPTWKGNAKCPTPWIITRRGAP